MDIGALGSSNPLATIRCKAVKVMDLDATVRPTLEYRTVHFALCSSHDSQLTRCFRTMIIMEPSLCTSMVCSRVSARSVVIDAASLLMSPWPFWTTVSTLKA